MVSFPLGLDRCGIYGALINVIPNWLLPDAGCTCGCPCTENGSAFSAELVPNQKTDPCGCPGLNPLKFPRPPGPPGPPNPPPPKPPPKPPPPKAPPKIPAPPPCARMVSIASRIRSGSIPARGLTCPDCPLIATESPPKSEFPAADGNEAPPPPACCVGVPACVSVSEASALTRLKLCAPFAASCLIADSLHHSASIFRTTILQINRPAWPGKCSDRPLS